MFPIPDPYAVTEDQTEDIVCNTDRQPKRQQQKKKKKHFWQIWSSSLNSYYFTTKYNLQIKRGDLKDLKNTCNVIWWACHSLFCLLDDSPEFCSA